MKAIAYLTAYGLGMTGFQSLLAFATGAVSYAVFGAGISAIALTLLTLPVAMWVGTLAFDKVFTGAVWLLEITVLQDLPETEKAESDQRKSKHWSSIAVPAT